MSFKVYLRKHIMPFEIIDGRLSGASVVGAGSTQTRIVFNPGLTGQSTTWVGGTLILSSGAQVNLGSVIGAEGKTGTTLNYVDLDTQLQFAPSAGETFWLIRKSGYISYETHITDISPYVDEVSFATDIELGFETASVTLNQRISALTRIFSQFVGMNLIIDDAYGRRCYYGIVTTSDLEGWGGTISAVGYGSTFNWYDFSALYDTTATNTAPKILTDICHANPYISKYTLGIDRNGSWHSAQVAVGGIGPQDFVSQRTKASDAIKTIIDMGYYPTTFDKVALQIWDNAIPTVCVYRRNPTIADYYINTSNFGFGYDGMGITGDIGDAYSVIASSYTDSNGKTIDTPGAYNVALLQMIGMRTNAISSGNSTAALAAAVVGAARQDKDFVVAPGSIKIKGKVKHHSSANMSPAYLIKAGDVIAIEGDLAQSSLYRNSMSSPTIFTVGHTAYSSSDDVMTVTAMSYPLVEELFSARIKLK